MWHTDNRRQSPKRRRRNIYRYCKVTKQGNKRSTNPTTVTVSNLGNQTPSRPQHRTFLKPMSLAYSRKQRRQTFRPYLRIKPGTISQHTPRTRHTQNQRTTTSSADAALAATRAVLLRVGVLERRHVACSEHGMSNTLEPPQALHHAPLLTQHAPLCTHNTRLPTGPQDVARTGLKQTRTVDKGRTQTDTQHTRDGGPELSQNGGLIQTEYTHMKFRKLIHVLSCDTLGCVSSRAV